jgi:hypothetical protein
LVDYVGDNKEGEQQSRNKERDKKSDPKEEDEFFMLFVWCGDAHHIVEHPQHGQKRFHDFLSGGEPDRTPPLSL